MGPLPVLPMTDNNSGFVGVADVFEQLQARWLVRQHAFLKVGYAARSMDLSNWIMHLGLAGYQD